MADIILKVVRGRIARITRHFRIKEAMSQKGVDIFHTST